MNSIATMQPRRNLPVSQRRLEQPIDYIPHPDFDNPEKEAEILAPLPRAGEYEAKRKAVHPPRDVPSELAASYDYPLLDRDQEHHLFRKMNFLKFKAARLREMLLAQDSPELRDESERLLAESEELRSLLISANIRLVVSIAKRYARRNGNLFELVSDGMVSLVRSVEKFDCHRGFKLSTYASWAIMKGFARSIPLEKHRHEHFVTGHEEVLDLTADKRSDEYEALASQERASHDINRLLEKLDTREREVIRMRAGLNDRARGLTLEEIGREFGISKERVRQINVRAMKKLRCAAVEQGVEVP